ncbi:hypothetical protein WDW86_17350 [Bdellovibrionota bacterium FG-2]
MGTVPFMKEGCVEIMKVPFSIACFANIINDKFVKNSVRKNRSGNQNIHARLKKLRFFPTRFPEDPVHITPVHRYMSAFVQVRLGQGYGIR